MLRSTLDTTVTTDTKFMSPDMTERSAREPASMRRILEAHRDVTSTDFATGKTLRDWYMSGYCSEKERSA